MIIRSQPGDILHATEDHIAFAVNIEGLNGGGLAGNIAENFWGDLLYIGPQKLGTILSKNTTSGKCFHAFVVHSLYEGWDRAPELIEECFNKLELPTDQEIASVVMGSGIVGRMSGANPRANYEAMQRSTANIAIYGL